jgi:hypothetical protein
MHSGSVDFLLRDNSQPVLVLILRCDDLELACPIESRSDSLGTLDVIVGGRSQSRIPYRSLLEYWLDVCSSPDLELVTASPWTQLQSEGSGSEWEVRSPQSEHSFYIQVFYPAAACMIAALWVSFAWAHLGEDVVNLDFEGECSTWP